MDRVKLKINGEEYSVGCEVSSDMTLVDYLRHKLEMHGTKYMCREAGCGACIVAASTCPGAPVQAVNSCMVSITSCHNWEITTIEELGNRKKGYHKLQKVLAECNGSQCGYCSPAWVMAFYCLLETKKNMTMLEIEQSFGSNICRCTGYRPILEAFKTFAKDAAIHENLQDIEDLDICKKTGRKCFESNYDDSEWCMLSNDDAIEEKNIDIQLKDGRHWFRALNINDIFEILKKEGDDSYMLIFGNTAKGAYPIVEYPRVLIDISAVSELKGYKFDQNLIVGAGVTLTELLYIFETEFQRENFGYLQKFYDHLKLVAHIAVRNLGSIGGNLMIIHRHRDFPSDIFLLFETVGAQLTIQNSDCRSETVTMKQFLNADMKGRVILNVMLPPLNEEYSVITFKTMPRSQNAHAIVNAGFLYRINNNVVKQSRLVFGGLSSSFRRALATEKYLANKYLFNNHTLQSAIKILEEEMVVTENPPEPSVKYRKQLALGLFYKGLLTLCPRDILHSRYQTGAIKIHETRPVSKAVQGFETKPSLWPLNQPMPKLEALIQCAGEAFYTDDLPSLPREVFAAFALSTVSMGNIESIDASDALKCPGVIAFYTANDIPGLNSFIPADAKFNRVDEELLCSGLVRYYNQPIGIVVAESQHIADVTAKTLVHVKYSNVKKPVIDIREASKDPNRVTLHHSEDATDRSDNVARVVKGSNVIYGQYHFTMELIGCVTLPSEEGVIVYATTQAMDALQTMISRVLNIDKNRVDIHVRRLGGAFGIKVSRSSQVAVACSLVAYKLNRPCRFILSLPATTRTLGKRFPSCTDYEIGVSSTGTIQYMDYKLYEGDGYVVNEQIIEIGVGVFNNCYDKSRWNFKNYNTIIDVAKNSWCRSPGTLEHIAMTELMMEQISYELSLDPLEVRLANLDNTNYGELKCMIDDLIANCSYTTRREAVDKFNAENRWTKRGLRLSLLRWTPLATGSYDVNLSVYHTDGTVAITHGGIEMGQGINTLAVQICAYLLKIPIDKIVIKANNTTIAPNCVESVGSLTSQNVAVGVRKCCEQLLGRLDPIRNQLENPTWEELIQKAFEEEVDLQSHGFVSTADAVLPNIYGVSVAEVAVDILTGESEVLRVDLMQDAGQSVNPEIDIGQTEGAFIMGLGYWTCENLVYDINTGELLTDRTWNYYVPQARDIPQDFRVYLKRNSFSNWSVFGAKGIGEPPICLSVVMEFAIRQAIVSARLESGIPTTIWFPNDGPYTLEKICLLSSTKTEDFKYY